MGQFDANTVARQFKRTFDELSLNELGKATRLCRREREITPYRLMLTLIEVFASTTVNSIADIHRAFNAICECEVEYKPFHNQLCKDGFPVFVRLMLTRLLNELACHVLRFTPQSPFARFANIRIQDGTSFALKASLAKVFPGRFTTISPAAVELHVDFDLMSETANRIVLSPDSDAERQFLPPPEALAGQLLLGDRGYYGQQYLRQVDMAGGHFIMRGKCDLNPLILKAMGPDGQEVKKFRDKPLKELKAQLSKYEWLDLDVRFKGRGKGEKRIHPLQCRLIVHPNLRKDDATPRYLVTNLAREEFTPEHISDGYRLRWQIELLFKEWKSHNNLHAFDTKKPNIAEGLIWASLCASTIKRYCAHATQRIARVAMSTRTVAMCIHHVLTDILYDLMHRRRNLAASVTRAIEYLSRNARRAHLKRDAKKGRLKLGLTHVYAGA